MNVNASAKTSLRIPALANRGYEIAKKAIPIQPGLVCVALLTIKYGSSTVTMCAQIIIIASSPPPQKQQQLAAVSSPGHCTATLLTLAPRCSVFIPLVLQALYHH